LRPGRTRDCSEILTGAIASGAAVLSVDYEQKSFLEFCGNARVAAATAFDLAYGVDGKIEIKDEVTN